MSTKFLHNFRVEFVLGGLRKTARNWKNCSSVALYCRCYCVASSQQITELTQKGSSNDFLLEVNCVSFTKRQVLVTHYVPQIWTAQLTVLRNPV